MGFFEDMEKCLLEAIAMEKGEIPVIEKEGMPAPTFVAQEQERILINELTIIRKNKNISQCKLAEMTGYKQQAISRFENKNSSPSLKSFISIADALGYNVVIEKR